MTEFNNRIKAQRDILSIINTQNWREELLGLSNGALDRWTSTNMLAHDSPLVKLIYSAAAKLFFLANKSQEQITEEYDERVLEIFDLKKKIAEEIEVLKSLKPAPVQ